MADEWSASVVLPDGSEVGVAAGFDNLGKRYDAVADYLGTEDHYQDASLGVFQNLQDYMEGVFGSEGAFEGRQRWMELSPDYLVDKVTRYGVADIGFRTGDLFRSLTSTEDNDAIRTVHREGYEFGSSVDYAENFDHYADGTPKRPVFDEASMGDQLIVSIFKPLQLAAIEKAKAEGVG